MGAELPSLYYCSDVRYWTLPGTRVQPRVPVTIPCAEPALWYAGNSGYSNDGADWTMPTDSQRPSYYEPTVAILREAGIDVQKDWFLPAQYAAATHIYTWKSLHLLGCDGMATSWP